MGEITCAGCKEQTPAKYISNDYISDGFCGLCCVCVSKRLDAQLKQANAVVEAAKRQKHYRDRIADGRGPGAHLGYDQSTEDLDWALAALETEQEPDIHRGIYHHPDCNYWKWDWRFSWDATDCNCEYVAGPTEPAALETDDE